MRMIQTVRTAMEPVRRALSVARRSRALLLPAGIALLCTYLQVAGLIEPLRFDRDAIEAGALWRLLTGNFVHLGLSHLLMNLAGLGLVVALVWRQFDTVEWSLLVGFASLMVGLGLYCFNTDISWYVGFSGTLHALIIAGCLGDLRDYPRSATLLLVLVVAKLIWEQFGGALPGSEATAGGLVVVDSHLYGALAGAVLAPLMLWRRRRRS